MLRGKNSHKVYIERSKHSLTPKHFISKDNHVVGLRRPRSSYYALCHARMSVLHTVEGSTVRPFSSPLTQTWRKGSFSYAYSSYTYADQVASTPNNLSYTHTETQKCSCLHKHMIHTR